MIRPFHCAAMPYLLAAGFAALIPVAQAQAQPQAQTPAAPAVAPASLPPPVAGKPSKAQPSPVVDSIAGGQKPGADAKPPTQKAGRPARKRLARRYRREPPLDDVDRPALAGVALIEPLPPRREGPRPIVPTPAYFVDSFVAAFTIPPPPVVCRQRPRDGDLPDPRIYREVPVACSPDIE